jgi:catechol 2,3-dioxygenase-like lactoylglutathione lyase family enzyme
MDRINHVKIVTPDPEAIDRFLREVLDIPEGWRLGEAGTGSSPTGVVSPARDAAGEFTAESVHAFRGAGGMDGRITGSTESRQFQILRGDRPHIWAVAIGTRHVERAHQRCVERGIACTDPSLTSWGEGGIRFFFAEVGGIVFEVMRAEDVGPEQ